MTRRQVAQGGLDFPLPVGVMYIAVLTKLFVCPLPLEVALMACGALRCKVQRIDGRAERARRRRRWL